MSGRVEGQSANQEIPSTQNNPRFVDWTTIKYGFNFGIGTTAGGMVVFGAIGAAKAAWVYHTTITGAQTGLVMGGPGGAVIGGLAGATFGMIA